MILIFACNDFLQISGTYGFVQIPGILGVLFKFSDVQKPFYSQFKLIGQYCFLNDVFELFLSF
jgi:hypothetical protein